MLALPQLADADGPILIVEDDHFIANTLLARLNQDVLREIRRHASIVPLRQESVLQQAGAPAEFVWFPESGLCILSLSPHGVDAGMIGPEGAVGLDAGLVTQGRGAACFHCSVAVPGLAMCVGAAAIRKILLRHPEGRDTFFAYLQALHAQTASTLDAAAGRSVIERVARWLAMANDRVGPDIPVTHDMISLYLGVRRAGVTEALQLLEAEGRIERRRGRIRVRDPMALRAFIGPRVEGVKRDVRLRQRSLA